MVTDSLYFQKLLVFGRDQQLALSTVLFRLKPDELNNMTWTMKF